MILRTALLGLAALALSTLTACGDGDTPAQGKDPTAGGGAAQQAEGQQGGAGHDGDRHDGDAMHSHSEHVELGTTELAGHRITVVRLSTVEPHHQVEIDLSFAGDGELPAAVRGWIGTADPTGSRKGLFESGGERRLHGHLEAPDPLPDGCALWLQIGDATTSVALQ